MARNAKRTPPPLLDRFLALPAVEERTGLRRTSIYDLARRGDFPKARKVTERASRWLESEIAEWMAARPVSKTPSPNPRAARRAGGAA